jgi:hypothetical protein
MKLRLHCSVKNFYIILAHCFNKGFLITYGQLYLKQSSATRSKCIMLIHKLRAVDKKLYTC